MQCYCCNESFNAVRKVRLRPWREAPGPENGPNSPVYEFYRKELTYRWAVVCLGCYRTLDNASGMVNIGEKAFNLAGTSRKDKAPVLDEEKYQAWQRREEEKLGLQNGDRFA